MIIDPPVSSLPETNRLHTVAARKVITGKPYFLFSAKKLSKTINTYNFIQINGYK